MLGFRGMVGGDGWEGWRGGGGGVEWCGVLLELEGRFYVSSRLTNEIANRSSFPLATSRDR